MAALARLATTVKKGFQRPEQTARIPFEAVGPSQSYGLFVAMRSKDWDFKETALEELKAQEDDFVLVGAAHIVAFYSGDDVEEAALSVLKTAVKGKSDRYGEMIGYYAAMNPAKAKPLRKLLE